MTKTCWLKDQCPIVEELSRQIALFDKKITDLTAERDRYLRNLDHVADQWKDSQHQNKLLNMALRAANNGNDTDDLRYAYEPNKGIEQLKTVCNGVIVHIPVDWLVEIVGDLTARAEQAEAKLNQIIVAAKIRKQVIAQARERVVAANKRPYTGVEVDLYAVKNADRELHKVIGELLEGA